MNTELRLPPVAKPTDRFKLLPLPVVSPGKCACCGAVDRPVVDFSMDIQFYGAVLLCITCLAEAARVIDMVPAVEVSIAEEAATLSFSNQLSALGMRTITDEQFESLTVALGSLSDVLLPFEFDYSDVVAESAASTDERLFEVVTGTATTECSIIQFPDSDFEPEYDLAISERPDSVSADNGDGDDFFTT